MTAKENQVPTGKKSSKESSEPSGKKTKKDSENSGKTTKNEPLDVAPTYHEPSYAEKKVDKILSFLRSPTNKLFILFLNYTVNVFDEILTSLQANEPKAHILRRCLQCCA